MSNPEHERIRAAIRAAGMPPSNAVRPYRGADLLARTVGTIQSGPLHGARLAAEIHRGKASDGWRSNFDTRPVWWVTLIVEGVRGYNYWTRGARSTREAHAWRDYLAAAKDIRDECAHVEVLTTPAAQTFYPESA